MKRYWILPIILMCITLNAEFPSGDFLLQKIDENMYSNRVITESEMIIHGRRSSKSLRLKSWKEGDEKSFSEYLYPPRDAGTKMLKLGDDLWIYNPQADRTIRISGHMLRQSVMGSDLSYEDLMEESEMGDKYRAMVIAEEVIDDRPCWVVELIAMDSEIAYYSRKLWVDKERYLAIKEERFAKSGKLLKSTHLFDIIIIDERWYPKRMIFKDELKKGKGTELVIHSIDFDADIPESTFSKAALRK